MAIERNEIAAQFMAALLANPATYPNPLSDEWVSRQAEKTKILDDAFELADAFLYRCLLRGDK